jgi:glycosyltransferase involved in cell wall biosynthesis
VWQRGWDRFDRLATRLSNSGIRFVFVGGYTPNRCIQSQGFVVDQSQLAEIYSGAHLLLTPQRVDTLGRSELEALACGTPVITTASSGALESAALIKTAPEDLEEKTLELFESWKGRNGYDELAKAARSDCAKIYSFDSVMDKYEQMFKEVLDGPNA